MSAATQESKIEAHVQSIRANLESGITYEAAGIECPEEYGSDPAEIISAFDYLESALDIEYIVNGAGEYLGARILVAYGGPNIWINTRAQEIEGYWWGDSARASYMGDVMGLDDALRELWECR